MLRVAVAGCYSTNNPYEEAELTSLIAALRSLSPGVEITVFSQERPKNGQPPEVRTASCWNPFQLVYSIIHSDMILSGGKIRDDRGIWPLLSHFGLLVLARFFGKPLVSYAQEVGQLDSIMGRKLVRSACNKMDLITVRDGLSKERLLELGVDHPPVVVTADPVFTINYTQFDRELGRSLLERIRSQEASDSLASGIAGSPSIKNSIEHPSAASAEENQGEHLSAVVGARERRRRVKGEALKKGTEAATPTDKPQVVTDKATSSGGKQAVSLQPNSAVPDDQIPVPQTPTSSDKDNGTSAEEQKPLLGIVLQNIEENEEYKKTIAAAADRMVQNGWEVLFIPFDFSADMQVCQEVSWIMQQKSLILRDKLSLVECFSLLGEIGLLLGMKLPSLVMASVMRTPCVGIALDNKTAKFLEMTGQTSAGTLEELQADELYSRITEAWEERKETVSHMDQLLIQLRQQSWESAGLALSFFYSRQPSKRYDSRAAGRTDQGKANRAAHRG